MDSTSGDPIRRFRPGARRGGLARLGITAGRGLSLIPVTESGRVVVIVSVQNLMSSMTLLAEQRRLQREEAAES